MTQAVKCLLPRHEDLSRTHTKSQVQKWTFVNKLEKQKQDAQSLLASQTGLIGELQ